MCDACCIQLGWVHYTILLGGVRYVRFKGICETPRGTGGLNWFFIILNFICVGEYVMQENEVSKKWIILE